MDIRISPSLMCLDFSRMRETFATFEKEGIDSLHVDIMDGVFVPNYTLGIDFCKLVRSMTSIPLDFHLMIDKPDDKLEWFAFRKGESVSLHVEATGHLQRALAVLRERGVHPLVALNPSTPLSVLDYIMDDIDGVLIMTVNPGFAGQKMIPGMLRKITDCRRKLDTAGRGGVEIEVDGNVSFVHAGQMRKAGANVFVVGSSSIFRAEGTLEENIRTFRSVLECKEESE